MPFVNFSDFSHCSIAAAPHSNLIQVPIYYRIM